MPDDITRQLRRYGERLEESILAVDPEVVVAESIAPPASWWSRYGRSVAAAAAAVAVLVGGVALLAARDEDRLRTATQIPDRPLPIPLPDTTQTTPGTSVPAVIAIEGTATWVGGPDPRGTLRVGACPVGNLNCQASPYVDVGTNGTFSLEIPVDRASAEWIVAAYVALPNTLCVFDCDWRLAQVGPPTIVSLALMPTGPLELSVTARVIDVYVLDRDGNPFAGGGVLVGDARCAEDGCRGEFARTFSSASSVDGAARIVLDPTITYRIKGQAMNMDWPNPQLTIGADRFWSSPEVMLEGSEVDEGQIFLVDGGPSPPGG